MGQLNCSQIPQTTKSFRLTVYDNKPNKPYRFWVNSAGGVQYDTIHPKNNSACSAIQKHLKNKHNIKADPNRHARFNVIQIIPGQYCVLYKLRQGELNKFKLRPVKNAWKSKSLLRWIAALSATGVVGYVMKQTYDYVKSKTIIIKSIQNADEWKFVNGVCSLPNKMMNVYTSLPIVKYDDNTESMDKNCEYAIGFLLIYKGGEMRQVNVIIVNKTKNSLDHATDEGNFYKNVPYRVFAPFNHDIDLGNLTPVYEWYPQEEDNPMVSMMWCQWMIQYIHYRLLHSETAHGLFENDLFDEKSLGFLNKQKDVVNYHTTIWSRPSPIIQHPPNESHVNTMLYYKVLKLKFSKQWTTHKVHWNPVDIVTLQNALDLGIIITRKGIKEITFYPKKEFKTYIMIRNDHKYNNNHYKLVQLGNKTRFLCSELPKHVVDQFKRTDEKQTYDKCTGIQYKKQAIKYLPKKGLFDAVHQDAVKEDLIGHEGKHDAPTNETVDDLRDKVADNIKTMSDKEFIDLFNRTLSKNVDNWDMKSIRPSFSFKDNKWQ